MRLISTLLLAGFLLSTNLSGQPTLSEVRRNYAQFYSILKNNSISISLLDEYTNAYFGMGDKSLINQIIVNNILADRKQIYSSPLDTIQENAARSLKVFEGISPVSSDYREIPYHTFMYTMFNIAYLDSMEIIEAYFNLESMRSSHFLHIPMVFNRNSNKYIHELMVTYDFYLWAVTYPEEFHALTDLLNSYAFNGRQASVQQSNQMTSQIQAHFKNSFYSYYFPYGIDACTDRLRIASSQLIDSDLLSTDPNSFIQLVYESILDRAPSDEERDILVSYIENTPNPNVRVIYFVILNLL